MGESWKIELPAQIPEINLPVGVTDWVRNVELQNTGTCSVIEYSNLAACNEAGADWTGLTALQYGKTALGVAGLSLALQGLKEGTKATLWITEDEPDEEESSWRPTLSGTVKTVGSLALGVVLLYPLYNGGWGSLGQYAANASSHVAAGSWLPARTSLEGTLLGSWMLYSGVSSFLQPVYSYFSPRELAPEAERRED